MTMYIEAAASPKVLNHAWRLLKKEKGLWSEGISVAEMQHNMILHIMELSKELREQRYKPSVLRCFEIDKADGKKRIICASMVKDKLVQRAVLTVIEPVAEKFFHENSFGFRAGLSVDMALAKTREYVRAGWHWLGDADIKACFDTIPHVLILRKVKEIYKDPALINLIKLWLENVPLAFQVGGVGRGLPQGMVLSPFLSNLHLHTLDKELSQKKIPFVRFADDFLLFAKTEEDAKKALHISGECLKKLGLELHPGKTRVIKSSRQHKFLGKRLPDSKARFIPD